MSDRTGHIGIAGVSVEGALLCARIIAAEAERRLPTDRRPQVTMHMPPFALYTDAMSRGDLPTVEGLLVDSIGLLARAGADFAIIPANAPHIVFDGVSRRAAIPLIDLIAEVAAECAHRGFRRVGVLGVRWTMQSGLYDGPLRRRGVDAMVPALEDQETIHSIITDELFHLRIREESTTRLLAIIERLKSAGCDGIALACTELPLALNEGNCGAGVIDTTRLLAERALARSQPQPPG
jgi:aspartate racemase